MYVNVNHPTRALSLSILIGKRHTSSSDAKGVIVIAQHNVRDSIFHLESDRELKA